MDQLKTEEWSVWEEVDDELLMKLYRKAKEMKEKELHKIVLSEIRRKRLITINSK